jgi:excinuclease ABC subunit C
MTELDLSRGDAALEELPNRPAVFLIHAATGKPWLTRTNVLRRRLQRLLGSTDKPSRLLNLRDSAVRVEYRVTGSKLEAQFVIWELARQYLGPDYRKEIRLRLPPYVKLVLSNPYPRTQTVSRIGRANAVYFGPFRTRSTAVAFESEFLDLFQLRRCEEDLAPSEDHPGCMYGEMGRCLRPCQRVVGPEEYARETARVASFLQTTGKSLLQPAMAARDQASADMDFEAAAVQHQRVKRIEDVLGLRDEMTGEVNSLNAIAVVPSAEPETIVLGWLRGGSWQGFTPLPLAAVDGRAVSLDTRLRELASSIGEKPAEPQERMEQLAMLSRWFYSSWCDGEMLMVDAWDKIPWRKLVNAVARVAKAQAKPHPDTHSAPPGSP